MLCLSSQICLLPSYSPTKSIFRGRVKLSLLNTVAIEASFKSIAEGGGHNYRSYHHRPRFSNIQPQYWTGTAPGAATSSFKISRSIPQPVSSLHCHQMRQSSSRPSEDSALGSSLSAWVLQLLRTLLFASASVVKTLMRHSSSR